MSSACVIIVHIRIDWQGSVLFSGPDCTTTPCCNAKLHHCMLFTFWNFLIKSHTMTLKESRTGIKVLLCLNFSSWNRTDLFLKKKNWKSTPFISRQNCCHAQTIVQSIHVRTIFFFSQTAQMFEVARSSLSLFPSF